MAEIGGQGEYDAGLQLRKQSALQEVDRVCKFVRNPVDHEQAGECNFEVQAVQNEGPMQGH